MKEMGKQGLQRTCMLKVHSILTHMGMLLVITRNFFKLDNGAQIKWKSSVTFAIAILS